MPVSPSEPWPSPTYLLNDLELLLQQVLPVSLFNLLLHLWTEQGDGQVSGGPVRTGVGASVMSDLSAQALLQLAQLVLLLEQGQGLVEPLWDLRGRQLPSLHTPNLSEPAGTSSHTCVFSYTRRRSTQLASLSPAFRHATLPHLTHTHTHTTHTCTYVHLLQDVLELV